MKHQALKQRKQWICCLLAFLFLGAAAAAEPLPLTEDLAGEIVILYDEADPAAGRFLYSYRYPAVDPSHPDAAIVNTFFEYEVSDTVNFRAPMDAENWESTGENVEKTITYTITCNNDDYFSVLVCTRETAAGETYTSYAGDTFSRLEQKPGYTTTLPQILGILSSHESDTWLQDRQTARADAFVRTMIWEQIDENPGNLPFYDDFSEEDLELVFYPEEDFYLDESGNPVFFIQPGDAAPLEEGLMIFPLSLEEILDEM